MAQIFLSYSSEDRARVLPLVEALEEDGYTVWWDREIHPGPSFDREIEKAISEAECLIVVWSEKSIDSEWVRSEVEEGVRLGILVPVLIDAVMPPLAYRRRQSADLSEWAGERDGEYQKLLNGIQATLSAEVSDAIAGQPTQSAPRRRRRSRLTVGAPLFAFALLAALATGYVAAFLSSGKEQKDEVTVTRLEIILPKDTTINRNTYNPLAIMPNGEAVVFNVIDRSGRNRLFVRDLDSLEARPLSGTDEAGSLWQSPDSEWIIFNDPDTQAYRKMRVVGGASIAVAPSTGSIRGLSWALDGTIVLANESEPALMSIEEDGSLMPLTEPVDGTLHWYPHLINSGRELLYSSVSGPQDQREFEIRVLNLDSREDKPLVEGKQPLLTTSGHLLFVREGVVWASAYDAARSQVYGKQVPVLESAWSTGSEVKGLGLSDNGTLVYVQLPQVQGRELVWVDLDGSVMETPLSQTYPTVPRLSPDDSTVVFHHGEHNGDPDLWMHEFDRRVTTRLSFEEISVLPDWSADGARIVYTAGKAGQFHVAIRTADGTGNSTRLTDDSDFAQVATMVGDQSTIVFQRCSTTANCDIFQVSADGGKAEVLLDSKFSEEAPRVSASGRWIAYQSNESGRYEIYVRPFPNVEDGRWQLSSNGGYFPVWSRSDDRIFYVSVGSDQPGANASPEIVAIAFDETEGFSPGRPTQVLDVSGYEWRTGRGFRNFDISRDGDRFLMVRSRENQNRIVVVQNWFEELERMVPTRH